jgi:uncharacterized protein (DUF305 family)
MVHRYVVSRLLACLALTLATLVGSDTSPSRVQAAVQSQQPGGFDHEMHAAMDTMMEAMAAAPMTGPPEEAFLAMMIPHHQGAIDMARALLVYGRDPLVRQLAEEIIATQQVEIQSMQNRLSALRAGSAPDPAADQALGGTRGEADTSAPTPTPP